MSKCGVLRISFSVLSRDLTSIRSGHTPSLSDILLVIFTQDTQAGANRRNLLREVYNEHGLQGISSPLTALSVEVGMIVYILYLERFSCVFLQKDCYYSAITT